MSRRGYTTPYEERPTLQHVDETTVARREWEDLLEKFMIQAVRTGAAENHKGMMRDDKERSALKSLRKQIRVGVQRIERTFWRAGQERAYLSMHEWARSMDDSGLLSSEDFNAEVGRRLAALRRVNVKAEPTI